MHTNSCSLAKGSELSPLGITASVDILGIWGSSIPGVLCFEATVDDDDKARNESKSRAVTFPGDEHSDESALCRDMLRSQCGKNKRESLQLRCAMRKIGTMPKGRRSLLIWKSVDQI